MIRSPMHDGPGMSDFDRRFEAMRSRIDDDFERTRRYACLGILLVGAFWVGGACFAGWVVVCVMRHFGVI